MSIVELVSTDGDKKRNLADMPAMLRAMANDIEAGTMDYGPSLIWVGQRPGEDAILGCVGEYLDTNQVIGVLSRAVNWLCAHPKAGR